MFGTLLKGDGKGKFGGPECRGNWKFTLEEAPAPNEAIPVVAETEPQEKLQVQATFTADDVPPVIEAPGNLQTENSVVALRGQVSDSSTIVEFTINGTAAQINADGSFNLKRGVTIGDSEIVIAALDEWGNRAVKRIDVVRKQLNLALGDYHALVIGNNDYRHMLNLKAAIADAEAISALLASRYGFSVTTLINASRYDVIGAMSELRASLSFDTNLLIYYAGHGIVDPVTERGYWLPVDADQDNPANWVSNDDITDMLKAIPARHILVIANSCYSGTLTRAAPINIETWEDRRA